MPGDGAATWDIDATTDALLRRVASGRMRERRGDVPLADMITLLESELKYTVVA